MLISRKAALGTPVWVNVILVPPGAFESANVAFEYTPFGQLFARHVCTMRRSFVSFTFLPSRSCPTFHLPPTRELIFTYILVPATKQMALRIKLEDSGRQRADVPELRLVYRLTH